MLSDGILSGCRLIGSIFSPHAVSIIIIPRNGRLLLAPSQNLLISNLMLILMPFSKLQTLCQNRSENFIRKGGRYKHTCRLLSLHFKTCQMTLVIKIPTRIVLSKNCVMIRIVRIDINDLTIYDLENVPDISNKTGRNIIFLYQS